MEEDDDLADRLGNILHSEKDHVICPGCGALNLIQEENKAHNIFPTDKCYICGAEWIRKAPDE